MACGSSVLAVSLCGSRVAWQGVRSFFLFLLTAVIGLSQSSGGFGLTRALLLSWTAQALRTCVRVCVFIRVSMCVRSLAMVCAWLPLEAPDQCGCDAGVATGSRYASGLFVCVCMLFQVMQPTPVSLPMAGLDAAPCLLPGSDSRPRAGSTTTTTTTRYLVPCTGYRYQVPGTR